MDISAYLGEVRKQYDSGQATEHSYRPALHALFSSIDPSLKVINEPKKSDAGMPDFLFERDGIPLGWAEAKDINKDVIKLKGYSIEQRKRYENAYPNLIYTNGVDFEFIREGESVHFVSIADFLMGLQPVPDRFEELERQLRLFADQKPISVRSAARLADMMAAKAAIIKDEIAIALSDDPDFRSDLGGQFKSFQQNLLPNLTPGEFADIYAETITYGMFAARFHDEDLETFSRQEAMEKLPASNPFLKGLFRYIAGPNLPKRLEYIVDDLVQLMRASDPHSLFRDFGKFTARNDPFIHFYEDFLAAYNPKKRKARGVWYTPEPVVDFIVRAVDDVLKSEFGLSQGLADTSKVTIDWDTGTNHPKTGKPITQKREVHKVQILDPATGTGTFLAKVVQLISDRVKSRAPGKWSAFVEEDLLPRLHGFELLMASYAMCHMKLDMMLAQTDYHPSKNPPRLSVWLTNALEPAEREVRDLFFQPLAEEARGASEVKRQAPIMCVIGNPPYSGESSNKGDHIMALMDAYKKEPGGKQKLKERNPKWINDDYVKFIRMSEDLIAKNPSGGVLGFITNHGYLDNPTFRGMRWHLLKTFDKLWVLDLHGNTKKKEVSPDGSPDKNVFDIQQGVSLIIAVKNGLGDDKLADVWHGELWGTRKEKSDALVASSPQALCTERLTPSGKYLMFYPIDEALLETYDLGFSLSELFTNNQIGFQSHRDDFAVAFNESDIRYRLEKMADPSIKDEDLRAEFGLADNRDWQLKVARGRFQAHKKQLVSRVSKCDYRPFDRRYCQLDETMMDYPRWELLSSCQNGSNIALNFTRQTKAPEWRNGVVSAFPAPAVFVEIKDGSNFAPLWYYDEIGKSWRLNFDPKIYAAICEAAQIDPSHHADPERGFRSLSGYERPSEVKIFDYIYGVLHCSSYRSTFAEFLKIDFPRVPFPSSPEVFRKVSDQGEALRRLHLMEDTAIGDTPYPYHGMGDDVVAAQHPKFEDGRVWINQSQYFDNVPEAAWQFYIGGYQPAQKWLKDRKGRELSIEDAYHYQKIIKILVETDRIMQEIELPLDKV